MSHRLTTTENVDTIGAANILIDKLFASLLRAPDPSWANFVEKMKEDIRLLVCEANTHRHTSTCYKYSKNALLKICRMRMPREIFLITTIDPDSGEIRMRRSHPMINNFNQFIICACRCNMDIKFIWSGTDAKALVYYCTDYITKTNLSFHDTFSLMQKAVQPNDNNNITESSVDKARKLVLRCYNSLASQQELSGVQVATYLLDYGDHYTSYEFANIFLIAVERHLQNELEESRASLASASTTTHATNNNPINFIENEEEYDASTTEEQFSIEQTSDTQKVVLVNLRIDYQCRSPELESVCLYDFVSFFHRKPFTDKDRNMTEQQFTNAEDIRLNPGRPRQERYTFMREHPQAISHGIIKRLNPVTPVLLGPQIPRRDREETQERYSRAIATLFIPWRSAKDLCAANQSWREALSFRQESISTESKQIIENIQLLHECKKDRDAHLQQVIANVQASDEIDPRLFPRNMRIDDSDEDDDLDQNENYLNLLDNLADNNPTSGISHLPEKEQLYQDEALRTLHGVGRFANCTRRDQPSMVSTSLSHFSVKTRHSAQQNAEWQAAIKSDALRRRQQSIVEDTPLSPNHTSNQLVSTTTTSCVGGSPNQMSDRIQSVTTDASTIPTRRQVCEMFTLNDEQARAFYIVCRHADGESHLKIGNKQQQLIMCVPGSGGTGKSRLIEAITYYFVETQRKQKLRKLGPTAVSASLIGGHTIHSFLGYLRSTKRQKKTSKPGSSNIENDWKHVDYLIIDEISMVGLRLLAQLNELLTSGKRAPPEVPFGGINIILLGDYIQYMPVLDKPLYSNLERGSSSRLSTETDIQYGVGRSLVLQINTVTKLSQQMRTEDQKYLTLLNHLRLGQTTRDDFDYLCTRIIGPRQAVQSLREKPWCDAPILVFRNQLRTEINNRAALDKAKEAGIPLVVVVAHDKIRSKISEDDVIYERLLHIPDNKTELLPGLLPLVPNMPVLLTDNIACELGLSNGTQGIF
ncbi:unnamed protein product, partial [Adineta ricciae]